MKCENSCTRPVTACFSMSVLDGVLVLEANSLNNPENGFRISFQGLKRPGRGVDHQLHLVPRLKKSRAIPPLSGPSWLVIGWALPLHLPLPRNLRIIFWPFITYAFDKHTGNQKAISWRGLTPLHKYPTVTEPHFCCLSQVTSKHPSPLNTQSCHSGILEDVYCSASERQFALTW